MRPANRSYDRRPKLCAMQMEGIVSKSVAAPNRSGRNEAWLKIKCVQRGEFPIVGLKAHYGCDAGHGVNLPAIFEKSGLRRSANAANASRASSVCKRSRNNALSRLI